MSKYGHRPHNWFEAVINKLGGEENAERFLRNELVVSEPTRSWREEDGVIYFSVTSDGTTGVDWIKRLEGNGFHVGDQAKQVFRSPRFVPTSGVTTKVAVLPGLLFGNNDRITEGIRAEGALRKLVIPNAELAGLIRVKFTDKEIETMALRHIIVMHKPINIFDDDPQLLSVSRNDGGLWLFAFCGRPSTRCSSDFGFAFAVSSTPAIQ